MKNTSSLTFHQLSILHDGQSTMVGRPDKESYAYFPEDAVALLQQLQQGMCPDQAEIWYKQQYGEEVDIEDFLMTLRDLQFIREANDEDSPQKINTSAIFLQKLGKTIFSPFAFIVYFTLFVICLYAIFRFPALVPNRQDIFFSPSLILIEVTLLLFQILAVLFHESFHVLASRRIGIPTTITVGHRLGTLTLETSLTNLWSIPRRSRYLPLLAGMLADIIIFSICIEIAWISMPSAKTVSPLGTFCLAAAYTTLLRLAWQFLFYLRTDLYYVIATALGCVDLQNTTRAYIRNLFYLLLRRVDKLEDATQWHPRDRQVVRLYMPIYLVGYGISLGLLLFVGAPLTIQFLSIMLTYLSEGISKNIGAFLDAAFFLVLNLVPWIVLTGSILLKLKKRRSLLQKVQR